MSALKPRSASNIFNSVVNLHINIFQQMAYSIPSQRNFYKSRSDIIEFYQVAGKIDIIETPEMHF